MPVLGIVASSKFVETGSFELIATATSTSNDAFVQFLFVPDTYDQLQIRMRARTIAAGTTTEDISIRFNGITAGYHFNGLRGDGALVNPYAQTSKGECEIRNVIPKASIDSRVSGTVIVDIYDYANTNKRTTLRSFGGSSLNGTSGNICISGGFWGYNDLVSSIRIIDNGGGFTTGSTFSLYGIKGAA